MTIRAIAIDDEPLGLEVIAHFCNNNENVTLLKTFTRQSEAEDYLMNYPVDLIFLDIQMPNKDGIRFYKDLNSDVMVIFTTAYSQYAVEGFNVSAIDYLLKPIAEERFKVAVKKAWNELVYKKQNIAQTHLKIRADYKLYRIAYNDILFIEGLDDYIQIHLYNGKKIVARLSMKGILEKLPDADFIRVHRSYIIPLNKVKAIINRQIQIGEHMIPIGETYKDQVLKLL